MCSSCMPSWGLGVWGAAASIVLSGFDVPFLLDARCHLEGRHLHYLLYDITCTVQLAFSSQSEIAASVPALPCTQGPSPSAPIGTIACPTPDAGVGTSTTKSAAAAFSGIALRGYCPQQAHSRSCTSPCLLVGCYLFQHQVSAYFFRKTQPAPSPAQLLLLCYITLRQEFA